jgi:hypothetical protein
MSDLLGLKGSAYALVPYYLSITNTTLSLHKRGDRGQEKERKKEKRQEDNKQSLLLVTRLGCWVDMTTTEDKGNNGDMPKYKRKTARETESGAKVWSARIGSNIHGYPRVRSRRVIDDVINECCSDLFYTNIVI